MHLFLTYNAHLPYPAFLTVLFGTNYHMSISMLLETSLLCLEMSLNLFLLFLFIYCNSSPSSVIYSPFRVLWVSLMSAYNFKSVALAGGGALSTDVNKKKNNTNIQPLYNAYSKCSTCLSIYICEPFNPHNILWHRCHYPHFTGEELMQREIK